ncbi:MAG: phage tail tube protein [Solirubrobacteraceae bacterium]
MSNVIESGIGTLNYGKQTAKGSIATAATVTVGYDRPKWFDGQLGAKKTTGEEEYVDGQRFGSPAQYTDTVGGAVGTLTVQAQPENAGLYMAQLLGSDVVTGSVDPWTHTISTAGTSGAWGTWWQKVGAAVGPHRELYSDSKIAKLMVTTGDKQKTMHYAMDIACLNPAQVFAVDAAKTETATDPYYWTESVGAVTFDGTVLSEINEETLEIDAGIKPFYGNSIAPVQLIEGKGTIVSTLKSIVTDETRLKYNKAIFGETEPAAGKLPVKTVYYASAKTVYEKSATRKMTIERPRISVKPDEMVIGALREGGELPIAFGGSCLKEGATAALTIIVLSGEEKSYA